MRFIKFAVIAALFALPVSSASAGVLNSLVSDQVLKLEDVDYEIVLGGGGALGTNLVKGSRLLAVAQFPTHRIASTNALVFQGTTATEMITAVSYVEVTDVAISGGGAIANFTLGGLSEADWAGLGVTLGLAPNTLTGVADGTALVAFSDPIVGGTDIDHVLNGPSVADGVRSASEGVRLFEFGIDNFFTATTVDGALDPTNLLAIDSLNTEGDFTLLDNHTGLQLVEHNFLGFATGPSQLQLRGSLESVPGAGAYNIVTDTDVYLRAVPEPMSAVAFLGLFGLALGRRRRA